MMRGQQVMCNLHSILLVHAALGTVHCGRRLGVLAGSAGGAGGGTGCLEVVSSRQGVTPAGSYLSCQDEFRVLRVALCCPVALW